MGLFDERNLERNLAEIQSPRFPGERLVVCKNGELAQERARKRGELLAATDVTLERIREPVARGRLLGQAQIGLRVGQVVGRYKMAKHFRLEISDTSFHFERDQVRIAAEAALDGLYVIRSSVPAERMSSQELVRSYKRLARVERDFRMLKTTGLQLRPVYHRPEDRVRAHVFGPVRLCV
jgi:transposase